MPPGAGVIATAFGGPPRSHINPPVTASAPAPMKHTLAMVPSRAAAWATACACCSVRLVIVPFMSRSTLASWAYAPWDLKPKTTPTPALTTAPPKTTYDARRTGAPAPSFTSFPGSAGTAVTCGSFGIITGAGRASAICGEPIDRRSDLFSLGTVLYETLTLTRVFKRESDLATLKAVVSAEIPPPSSLRPEVPQELDAIILKALERDVSRRYQTAAELADALSAFLVGRQYVRSERVLADFMAGLFDADRRLGKLRVAQATASEGPDGTRKTPSLLKHLPQHLSPIRNTSSLPEVPVPISAAPPPAADVELPATTAKPTLARRQRRTRLLIAGGAGVSLLVTIALAAALKPREPEQPTRPPEVPRPVVEVTPPPTTPQPEKAPEKPSSEGDPKPTDPPSDPKVAKPKAATAKGKLTLDTTPWSEVFLKGRKLGDTPLVDYPLPAGVHVLTLVNDGKGLRSVIEVEIQPGNKTTVKKLKL